ncbi:MAG: acyl-CoA dehydrogenase family protein [Deltaproteobacteria bacterium]|nr:acyl-CoA dehydrogenase family protein [Deltaproteobacteria bacterium]
MKNILNPNYVSPQTPKSTHEVLNQTPLLEEYNLFFSDLVLQEALVREEDAGASGKAKEFGQASGAAQVWQWGFQANENPPKLRSHNSQGYRIDQVEYHPAYHELMKFSLKNGLQSRPWTDVNNKSQVLRAACYYMMAQVEIGHLCPVTMTYAVAPVLKKQGSYVEEWFKKVSTPDYDPQFKPSSQKKAVVFGMAMTEKQGGSDVRANSTIAKPLQKSGPGEAYHLTGHKWFCSAPMSDAFLVLAQAPHGLSCFLVPRFLPDGSTNVFMIQRLKDKLGNRSNASSEIEFLNTWGMLLGEEGRGVPTIIEMVNHTRLDCVIGSSALMRQAVFRALHHAEYRFAFGKKLIEQDLMKNVLADLILESEAATQLFFRLARAFDARSDERESRFRRLATAISKYWVCKRAPFHIFEAMECLGGNGYAEESILPRLYREAPVNSIWEGSGNVNCLDVLRAIAKDPESLQILFEEIEAGAQDNSQIKSELIQLKKIFQSSATDQYMTRRLVEKLILMLQASLLNLYSPDFVSDAFIYSRLKQDWGYAFGTLPQGTKFKKIIERAKSNT